MLIALSRLQNLPVGSFEEGGFVGKVQKTIISPVEGRVIGFLVQTKGFFASAKVASTGDVLDIDKGGLVLKSQDSLVEKDEIVRIGEILKKNFSLIGLKAISKNKNYIGRVSDALIESNTGDIMRLYVKRFWREFVFERSQIIEITLKNVILRHGKVKEKKAVSSLVQPEVA